MVKYKDKKWMLVILVLLVSFSFSSNFVNAWFGIDDGIALAAGCVFGVLTSAFSHQCLPYTPQSSSGNLCEECNTANPFGGCTEYKCRAIGANCKFENTPNGAGGKCTSVALAGAPKITEFEFGSITKNEVVNARKDGNNWNVGILNRNEAYYLAFTTDIPAVCKLASNQNTFSSTGGRELKITNGIFHADGTIFHILDDNDFNQQYPLCPEGGTGSCRNYIQCKNDDKPSALYSVIFQLRDTPDEQAPEIRTVEPENNKMFNLNDLTLDFKIGVIDPAGIGGCRYSTTLKKYGQMLDSLDCVPANFDSQGVIIPDELVNQNFIMECSKNFQIDPKNNFDIYVSCVDGLFNTNDPAQKFSYRGAKALTMKTKIDNIEYEDLKDDNSDSYKELTGTRHDLTAETFGGDNDKSICEYSYSFENKNYSESKLFENIPAGVTREVFENSAIRSSHNLRLDNLLQYSGKYHFIVNCQDPVGNTPSAQIFLDVNLPGRRFDDVASSLLIIPPLEPSGTISILNPSLKIKLGGGINGQGEGATCKWTTDIDKSAAVLVDRNKFNDLEGTFLDGVRVDHGNGFAHEYISNLGTLQDKKSYTYRTFCKDTNGAVKGPNNINFRIETGNVVVVPPGTDQCEIIDAKWVDADGRRTLSKVKQNEPVSLLIKGRNCANDLKINLDVYEDDAGPEINSESSLEGTFKFGEAVAQWNAEWEDDNGNPEYYFNVLVNNNLKKTSGLLEVEKIQCTIDAACIISGTQCSGKYGQDCDCVDIPNDNCPAGGAQPPGAQPGTGRTLPLLITPTVSGANGPNPVITLETRGGVIDATNKARGRALCYYADNFDAVFNDQGTKITNITNEPEYTKHTLQLEGFSDRESRKYYFKCADNNVYDFENVTIETKFSQPSTDPNLPIFGISEYQITSCDSSLPRILINTYAGLGEATCRISEKQNEVRNNAGILMSKEQNYGFFRHSTYLSNLFAGKTYTYYARCVDDKNPRIFAEAELSFIPGLQSTEVSDGQTTQLNSCNVICSDPDGCSCSNLNCVSPSKINKCQTCGFLTAPELIIEKYSASDEDTLTPKLLIETIGGVSGSGKSQCKYGTDLDAVRAGQGIPFDQANKLLDRTKHSTTLHGLNNNDERTYFVQCVDSDYQYNTDEKPINVKIKVSTIPTTPPPQPPTGQPGECDVKSVRWVDRDGNLLLTTNVGAEAIAFVEGINCGAGNTASYKIMEKDIFVDDSLQPDDEVANGVVKFEIENKGLIRWITIRQEDGFNPNNEYYIKIQNKESGLLKVLEIPIQSTTLSIAKVSPNGLFGKKQIRLEAEINGGTNNGETVECNFAGVGSNAIITTTKANKEKLADNKYKHYLDVSTPANGNYIFSLNCRDLAGQNVVKEFSINLQEDNLAPEIQQIITKGTTKYITLSEPATCEIVTGDAIPDTNSKWTEVARDTKNPARQIINVNANYHLRCKDIWDNQMPITKINLAL